MWFMGREKIFASLNANAVMGFYIVELGQDEEESLERDLDLNWGTRRLKDNRTVTC